MTVVVVVVALGGLEYWKYLTWIACNLVGIYSTFCKTLATLGTKWLSTYSLKEYL